MKTSNKVLWSFGAFVALVVIAMIIVSRIFVGGVLRESEGGERRPALSGGEWIDEIREVGVIETLELDGAWRAEISNGDDYTLRLQLPEEIEPYVHVSTSNAVLRLSMDAQTKLAEGEKIVAYITTPDLSRVKTRGVAEIHIREFDGDLLEIDGFGVLYVDAEDAAYERLRLSFDGVSTVELGRLPVNQAEVDMKGVSMVRLHLTGGRLTGSFDAIGELKYSGKVGRVDVDSGKLASVKRVD